MADSPPEAASSADPPSAASGPASGTGSPRSARSGHSSPGRHHRRTHSDLHDEILKGAAWAPPWSQHELHAREVYERSKTPSPPCDKFKRDASYDEINPNVVRKRDEDEKKSLQEAKERRRHGGVVMKRAREFERKCRMECEKSSKHFSEYKGRMKKREQDAKGPFRNRAEQIIALGLNKPPSSRPQSPQK